MQKQPELRKPMKIGALRKDQPRKPAPPKGDDGPQTLAK